MIFKREGRALFWSGPVGSSLLAKGSAMAVGIVKLFNPKTGYGFIQPNDGSEFAFVHKNAIEDAGLDALVILD